MDVKEFIKSKGISPNRNIDVRGDLGELLGRIRLRELLEEYHQQQVKKLNIDDVSKSLFELDGKTIPVTFHVSKYNHKINIDLEQ